MGSMTINGIVESVIFRNHENGYTVFSLNVGKQIVTCVGSLSTIVEGEEVELQGEWKVSSKHGKQFIVSSSKSSVPTSIKGIEKYLASGLLKGVGEAIAARIVSEFGTETFEVLEYRPRELQKVKGISLKKAIEIGECYQEAKEQKDAVMFFSAYEITVNMALRIYNVYKKKTIETVKLNPYKLVEDVDGIGFLTADKIAKNLGIKEDSTFRMRAAILHCLKSAAERVGHTCMPLSDMKQEIYELLDNFWSGVFDESILSLKIDNMIKMYEKESVEVVAISTYYYAEQSIAKKLNLLNLAEAGTINIKEDDVLHFEKVHKVKFHEDQKKAIKLAASSGVSIITGGPGTGKTTIIKAVLNILKNSKKSFLLLAPTGRAAKRMSEATGEEAKTIHRGLEVVKGGHGNFFNYNEQNKLNVDAVILDEVSMVDVSLFSSLLKALKPETKLVLVGDKNQLPSVGAGNVLSDLLKSNVLASHNLTQIFRQDENSKIIENAELINQSIVPDLKQKSDDFFYIERNEAIDIANETVGLASSRLPQFIKSIKGKTQPEIQVLAPMRNGEAGVNALNLKLQQALNPQESFKKQIMLDKQTFREGDKVMQTINNYDLEWKKQDKYGEMYGAGVFNGDIGKILKIIESGEVMVKFDDDRICYYPRENLSELTHAYAITIHKSQGSEFDYVIIPIVGGPPTILTKNLLYTAVTRAKKMVVLVGSKKIVSYVVGNNFQQQRHTGLLQFLLDGFVEIKRLYE